MSLLALKILFVFERNLLKNIIKYFNKIIYFITGVFLAIMTIMVFSEVIFRYFLNRPIYFSSEITLILFAWLSFLMIIPITKNKDHLTITYFRELIPSKKIKRIIIILDEIIVLVFLAIFFRATLALAIDVRFHPTPALGISRFWLYFSMSVSVAGMFIMTLDNFIESITKKNIDELKKEKEAL